MAYKPLDKNYRGYSIEDTENELIFVGLTAMLDPPRPEVEEAVRMAHKAKIKIIMITGDYGITAESIARKIGIIKGKKPRIITGNELEEISDEKLKEELKEHVFFLDLLSDLGVTADILPTAISTPILAGIIFACSTLVYAVLSRIPVVKDWII